MCFKHHFEPHRKTKEFKVYSFSKKKKWVMGFLSLEVRTHTAGMWKRRGGWTRWEFCCLPFLKWCWRSSSLGIQVDEFMLTIFVQAPAESRMETFETGCLNDLLQTSRLAVSETRHRDGNKGHPANQQHHWVRLGASRGHLILPSFHHTLPCILPQSAPRSIPPWSQGLTVCRGPRRYPHCRIPRDEGFEAMVAPSETDVCLALPPKRQLFELEMTAVFGS